MDPVANPFAPGAGTPPPELAGRVNVLDSARIAVARIAEGRPAKSQILVGLRGVGKTVVLVRIKEMAEEIGYKA
jgi:Cdc6-like AAA superfamily ATPase